VDDEALTEAVGGLRKALRKRAAGIERARKALDALVAAGALSKFSALASAVPALRDADLGPLELSDEQAAVVGPLSTRLAAAQARARSRILGALKQAGESMGMRPEILSDQPLVVLLAPLTVELDLAADKARVQYARETISEVDLDASKIFAAREAALAKIRDEALDSADFFPLARDAYEVARIARGLDRGARIDLVDVLAPLGLLAAGVDAWRKKETVPPRFPRYLLAYQLRRLGRDRMLQHLGLRIELGTATGGSTRNKRDVLYVPSSPSEGQYHLSLRFVEAR